MKMMKMMMDDDDDYNDFGGGGGGGDVDGLLISRSFAKWYLDDIPWVILDQTYLQALKHFTKLTPKWCIESRTESFEEQSEASQIVRDFLIHWKPSTLIA